MQFTVRYIVNNTLNTVKHASDVVSTADRQGEECLRAVPSCGEERGQ